MALPDLLPNLLDLLFPAKACALCESPGEYTYRMPWCAACESSLVSLAGQWLTCQRCGKYMEPGRAELCADCAKKPPLYLGGKAVGPYQGLYRQVVHQFKFSGKQILAGAMARKMIQAVSLDERYKGLDLVIPVPLTKSRLRARGFHQTQLLAQEVSRALGLSLDAKQLRRTKETLPQSGLSRKERICNVEQAFQAAAPLRIRDKKVLLIDDVITTGATAAACAGSLLEAGASSVMVLAWAAGVGF